MSGSVSTRTAKYAALRVTASGQLRLPSTCGGAWKARRSSSPSTVGVAVARGGRGEGGARLVAGAGGGARGLGVAVGRLEHVRGAPLAVGQRLQARARAPLGVVEDRRERLLQVAALRELLHAANAD